MSEIRDAWNGWAGENFMARYEPGGVASETVLYRGVTTSAGNVGGTTIIASDLIGSNDFLTDTIVIIRSGACNRETRDISSFAAASGTITVAPAFSAQIASGVSFAVLARMSAAVEVAALQSDIGDASTSTLGNLYAILGNPSASLATTILDGIDGRTNNPTLNALLGIPDAAGRSINGNIGDFQAQTNLQTLLAALGIPDVAAKPLYTCLITDRLDSGTYGLSALNTDLDAILADTIQIADGTLPAAPTAGSLARFVASGGTALGTQLPASKSLYDVIVLDRLDHATYGLSALDTDLGTIITDTEKIYDVALGTAPTDGSLASFIATGGTALGTRLPASKSLYDGLSGGIDAVNRAAGKPQTLEVSVTSAANAGDVTVATITTQPCIIDSIIVHADTAQTANMTTCAVSGGASKVITFLSTAIATQANLNAIDKQVAWTGAIRLAATKTIVISLVGTGATAVDLTISITYHSAVNGGHLV